MEHPEERYYKLSRFLLSVNGLWPYQSQWSALLMRTFLTVITLSSVFVQLSSILTSDITMEFIFDFLPTFLIIFGSFCHISVRIIYVDKLRELFDRMWNDWQLQKTHEIKIMHEHAETTRLLTLHYSLFIYVTIIGYCMWLFMPEILDVISPINETRLRTQPFHLEYFIDEGRYFYVIRSHICVVILSFPVIFLANSALFLAVTQHVCGMCELLGFVAIIETYHTLPFLMDLIGLAFLMGISLMQILTIVDNVEQATRYIMSIVMGLCYLFISTYMGQTITDASSNVYEKVYNSVWYDADITEQKLVLLIMKQRFRPLVLTACKFYAMSLQNFGMILQTAISYCMFMKHL